MWDSALPVKLEEIKLEKEQRLTVETGHFAYVTDKDGHIIRAFAFDKGDFRELNLEKIIDRIADYLKPHLDVKEFLKDWLKFWLEPDFLIDVLVRVEKGAAVKPFKGCYGLYIYGKKGKPFRVHLTKQW